jgi:hypothetical protein
MRGNTVRRTGPVSAAGDTVTSFADYRTTQCHQTTRCYQSTWGAVDRLPDDGFPVENPQNAGTERWLVEPVTSRFTRGRVAGSGGLSDR